MDTCITNEQVDRLRQIYRATPGCLPSRVRQALRTIKSGEQPDLITIDAMVKAWRDSYITPPPVKRISP